jgi:hypothetical protein
MTWQDWALVSTLPLAALGYVEAFTKWGPSVFKARRLIGFVLLGLAVMAYAIDLADRFGAFGPTKADLETRLAKFTISRPARLSRVQYQEVFSLLATFHAIAGKNDARLQAKNYADMLPILKAKPGAIVVDYDRGCVGCAELAGEIKNLFGNANWKIDSPTDGLGDLGREMEHRDADGLTLECEDKNNVSESAQVIIAALKKTEIPFKISAHDEPSSQVCELYVASTLIAREKAMDADPSSH